MGAADVLCVTQDAIHIKCGDLARTDHGDMMPARRQVGDRTGDGTVGAINMHGAMRAGSTDAEIVATIVRATEESFRIRIVPVAPIRPQLDRQRCCRLEAGIVAAVDVVVHAVELKRRARCIAGERELTVKGGIGDVREGGGCRAGVHCRCRGEWRPGTIAAIVPVTELDSPGRVLVGWVEQVLPGNDHVAGIGAKTIDPDGPVFVVECAARRCRVRCRRHMGYNEGRRSQFGREIQGDVGAREGDLARRANVLGVAGSDGDSGSHPVVCRVHVCQRAGQTIAAGVG